MGSWSKVFDDLDISPWSKRVCGKAKVSLFDMLRSPMRIERVGFKPRVRLARVWNIV